MKECHQDKSPRVKERLKRIALVGNPNVGKSVIFGLLTGKYATVSNYPGTTVEVTYGNAEFEGKRYLIVDTPGVNSLTPMSEDERVTRDILLSERPEGVIQVGDSKNLKRTLALTAQIAEMGLPTILVLNMEDEARDLGIEIDIEALKKITAIEVIPTIAPERKGIKELRASVAKGLFRVPTLRVSYSEEVENCITFLEGLLPEAAISRRSLALMMIAGDESLREWFRANIDGHSLEELEAKRAECRLKTERPSGALINEARLRLAEEISERTMKKTSRNGGKIAYLIGKASMHPFWGLLILFLVLYGLYEFVGVFGASTLVGLLEETIFGEYLNPAFTKIVDVVVPVQIIRDLLVGEYGLITMALTYAIGIILPITTTFFMAFAVLEDSGYLPRLAIMSNRVFNFIGLSGKAVLPMVLGLGCGTMAVMTTRILESRRDRMIASFLLALAVPCAAQLGVILGMLGSMSATALGIWLGCVLGVLLITGFFLARILPGEKSEFFLEIPPIRKPNVRNILLKTYTRAIWYLKEAVPLFILGTFVLFVLDRIALLQIIERIASPIIVNLLGLPERATGAFLIGFLRRDYGAAGLFAMQKDGLLSPVQAVVSLVTVTLFIPCLANFFMLIKEMGARYAVVSASVIFAIAITIGSALNYLLRALPISL